MNQAVHGYVRGVVEKELVGKSGYSVLEVGSYNVNGSVRELFASAGSYLGIDKREGPGVDRVVDFLSWSFSPPYDVVVSTEMLEHCVDPHLAVNSMALGSVHDGLIILTARGNGYGLHDEPEDYWRFTPHGLRLLMERAGIEVLDITDDRETMGVYGYGRRK